jgi:phage tail-like protein
MHMKYLLITCMLCLSVSLQVVSQTKRAPTRSRFDPYKNFKFRVKWGGRYVAGFSQAALLESPEQPRSDTQAVRPGEQATILRNKKTIPITLEHGVTYDEKFELWAREWERWFTGVGAEPLRQDILIEIYDEAGQLLRTYKVYGCALSQFQAAPNTKTHAVAVEVIKLENEGWKRLP